MTAAFYILAAIGSYRVARRIVIIGCWLCNPANWKAGKTTYGLPYGPAGE